MEKILDFELDGFRSIHFFIEGLEYPVAIAVFDDKEEELLSYMEEIFPTSGFTTTEIADWCEEQELVYSILDI
ncbi:hypothetical protein [Faecalicatena contorta]|uniref:hypothetical protein n=1 Tax=Faecalicatena contorta TaxID=39482 RepID=UPI001F2F1B2E|nr:hypothetical protein [Faecalicatena contorta]MCF2554366.1 hypothetical protein [Faecalicatena contorta]